MLMLNISFAGRPRMIADSTRIMQWETVTRSMEQLKRPDYKLALSKGSLVYQGCTYVNRWGEKQTKTMTKAAVKTSVRKWIFENIPVKPLRDPRNHRRKQRKAPDVRNRERVEVFPKKGKRKMMKPSLKSEIS